MQQKTILTIYTATYMLRAQAAFLSRKSTRVLVFCFFIFGGGVLVSSQESVHSTIEGHTIVPE